jgi:hypothetical protein
MFEREALWLHFGYLGHGSRGPAVKVSVGGTKEGNMPSYLLSSVLLGVNAITGIAKDLPTPPSQEQDYIVAGLQPWLDGISTEPGVVRQV